MLSLKIKKKILIMEFFHVKSKDKLINLDSLKDIFEEILYSTNTKIFSSDNYIFPFTSGITLTFIIGASFCSVSTWPEGRYMRAVIDFCSENIDVLSVYRKARTLIKAKSVSALLVCSDKSNKTMVYPIVGTVKLGNRK